MDTDEPTLLTAFDREGNPHDGRLLASSEFGCVLAIGERVIAFTADGWSLPDGALVLCPEVLPLQHPCAEVPS